MKALLYKTVQPYRLTPEELVTVTVEVEAILNSRQLLPMDSAPVDGEQVLTPAHFLIGRSLKSLPCQSDRRQKISVLKRWALCQRLTEDLWCQWSGEYIQLLQKVYKWRYPKQSVQVNDIILVKDDELFMRSWPQAVVTKVHPGPDGLVRVATVRTTKGTYKRAITRLVPLLQDATDQTAPRTPPPPPPPQRVFRPRRPSSKTHWTL